MRKFILSAVFFFLLANLNAQIQVLKLVGKEGKNYTVGFGALLKFAFPVSEADNLSLEGGINYFLEKGGGSYGMTVVPVKLGYRYTLDRSSAGFYVEPQAGYNVFGERLVYDNYDYVEQKFNGIIGSVIVGYLFQPGRKIQFDLGGYYENIFLKGDRIGYIGLRLTSTFGFGRRDE